MDVGVRGAARPPGRSRTARPVERVGRDRM